MASSARLRARGLGLTVDDRTLYQGLDLDVHGGLSWIRGRSGVGKSQLLRQIAGLVPAEGTLELEVDGRPMRPQDIGWPTWRTLVAYVPQAAPRFERPGEAVLAEVDELRARNGLERDDPKQLTRRWGLDDRAWSTPLAQLSGGEAQRLWLALVLAGRPPLVLLDEPTAALDPESAAAVEHDLSGRTGLLVTHDAAFGERLAKDALELTG